MPLESFLSNASRGFSVHAQQRQPMELYFGLLVFSANRSALCSRSLHTQCPTKRSDSSPAQREDLTDPQAGHCRKNDPFNPQYTLGTQSWPGSNSQADKFAPALQDEVAPTACAPGLTTQIFPGHTLGHKAPCAATHQYSQIARIAPAPDDPGSSAASLAPPKPVSSHQHDERFRRSEGAPTLERKRRWARPD
jgi:hypothetical protein